MSPELSPDRPIPGGLTPGPLHGSYSDPLLRARTRLAHSRARALLMDGQINRLLSAPRERRDLVAHARQVFVNRNLRMANVELLGFDMDYEEMTGLGTPNRWPCDLPPRPLAERSALDTRDRDLHNRLAPADTGGGII